MKQHEKERLRTLNVVLVKGQRIERETGWDLFLG
jgi:hypothetical protein